jgi:hypothetical protein
MSVPVRPAAERKRRSSFRTDVGCVDIGVQAGFQIPKGLRPSRAEGIALAGLPLATPGLADGQGCSAALR